MSDSFGQAYEHLTDFIRSNPEIEILESVTSIPDNVRAEFYRRFNAVRDAFVETKFPLVLERAKMLQENYAKAEGQVSSLIDWEETPEVSRVQRFLRNVTGSMARELFDPLFDLLKGRNSLESFEQKSAERIDEHWPALFRGGYEKWAVLSLVSLLEPEKVLRVDVRPLKHGERAKSADHAPWDDAPGPEESHCFFFAQPRNAILTVPDLIVQSAKLNRYLGIRSEFREGLYKALNPSQKREWVPLETDLLFLLESGPTLIYIAEEAQQIALIADVNRFCRPDMILWCVDSLSMALPNALERARIMDQQINPQIGTFVVATDPWPESLHMNETTDSQAPIDEQSLRVRILNTGFDTSRLLPIIDALEPGSLRPEMT